MSAKIRTRGTVPTDAERATTIARELSAAAERGQARHAAAERGTDVLRYAAQGIITGFRDQGQTVTVGCVCGAVSQSLLPGDHYYGGLREDVIWAVVGILEHVQDSGSAHFVTTLVTA